MIFTGLVLGILLISAIFVGSTDTNTMSDNNEIITTEQVHPTASVTKASDIKLQATYTPHLAIYIGGEQNIIDLGFPGSGTASSPYVISGYRIDDTVVGALIDIRNINVHVQIANNFLNGTVSTYHGVYIQNSTNIEVVNNIITVQETASAAQASGVSIFGDSHDNTVTGNTIMNSDHGMYIQSISGSITGPHDNLIQDNTFVNIPGYGIKVSSLVNYLVLTNNNIVHNNFTNIGTAISVATTNSYAGTSYMTISHNTIADCSTGIELGAQSYDYQYPDINRYITVLDNTILRSSFWGVYISNHSFNSLINNTIKDGQDIGIYLRSTVNNTISGNTVFKNQKDGIKLYYTNCANNTIINNVIANNSANAYYYGINMDNLNHGNTIANNTIANNTSFGMYAQARSAPYNYISNNDFIDNNPGGVQATGREFNIYAYNYWSDWTEPDANNDGIVDQPYEISVTYTIYDLYPLTHRNTGGGVNVILPDPPTISSPADAVVEYQATATVVWSGSSSVPGTYTIYKNGSTYASNSWDGSDISVDLSYLYLGWYNFTTVVVDVYGQQVVDTVMIDVVDTTPPTIMGPVQVQATPAVQVTIQWNAYDSFPGVYSVLSNGSEVATGEWAFEVNITYSFQESTGGMYNITLVVTDISGNEMSHVTMVAVNSDNQATDTTAPSISSPADIDYTVGKTGNQIVWDVSDSNPDSYQVYLNSEMDSTDTWTTGSLTISVDDLPVGQYNFTIVVSDTWGNEATDTVMVTVIASSNANTTSTNSTTPQGSSKTNTTNVPGFVIFLIVESVIIVGSAVRWMKYKKQTEMS